MITEITAVLFTILLLLGLLITFIYSQFRGHGRVMLPPGNESPGLYCNGTVAVRQPQRIGQKYDFCSLLIIR